MSASPYGLSIVLDFEDNASEGMKNAANAFSGLSGSITNLEAGIGGTSDSLLDLNTSVVGMSVMGSSLQNMGSGLLNTLKGVSESVIETSSSFENFDITLQALYKSEEAASKVTSDLFKYAAKSPFQVEDLQSMVVTLKSQGLEAFQEMTGAQTGLKQSTMDWIGDLQAFRPGETALKWKRAIQNFLSGTNNKSAEMLRNILDVGKLDDYLGHSLGTTVEGRMKDLMEIVEKTGMAGMQNRLSKTWSVTISNMEDTWSQFAYQIGFGNKENSMYKAATNSARNVLIAMSEVLGNNDFIKATSDAFLGLVSPIERVTEAVAMAGPALGKFLGNHPKIAKMATGFTALGGAAVWATGSLLKMSAGALNWLLNVQRLGGLSGVFNMLSNAVNMLSLRMVGLGAVAGVVYAGWKGDFLGIRTLVTRFTGQLGDIFKKTYSDMYPDSGKGMSFLESLDSQGLSGFTKGLKTMGTVAKEAGNSFRDGVYGFFKFFGLNLPSINSESFNLKNTLNELGDTIIEKFGGNAEKFKEKWGGVLSTVGKTTGAFGSAIGVVTLLGGAFKLLSGAGGLLSTNLKVIGATLFSPAGILGMGLTGLILGYQNDFLGLQGVVTPIVDKFQSEMKRLKDSFGQKNGDKKNTIVETIKSKLSELNKASKEWRTDGVWDYIDGSTMIKHQTEQGKSIGEVLAQGIASGLIAFGGPIQKAMGVAMWSYATNIGGIREGTRDMVSQLINAKDLLLEMSTGYGPKSVNLAQKFGLTEFGEGITKLKRTSMSFLKSFMNGFSQSNTVIGRLVRDLFPDLDLSVNGILNAVGRLGSKISEKLGLDDKGNIADNYAQIAEKLGDIAAKAMLVIPAFGALKTAMNFGVNPLALSGIQQSFGLIGGGLTTTISGLLSGGGGVTRSLMSLGPKVAGIWKFSLQSALLQGGNGGGFLGGIGNSLTQPFTKAYSSMGKAFKSVNWKSHFKGFTDSFSYNFQSRLPRAVKSFKGNFSTGMKEVSLRAKNYGRSIIDHFRAINTGSSSITSPTEKLKDLKASFQAMTSTMKSDVKGVIEDFKGSFGKLTDGVKEGFKKAFSGLGLGADGTYKGTKEAFKDLGRTLNPFKDVVVSDKVKGVMEIFTNFRGGLLQAVASFQSSLVTAKFGIILEMLKSGTMMFTSAVAGATKLVVGLNGVAIGLAAVTSLALAFGTLTTSDWKELNEVLSAQPTILGKVGAGWDWFNSKLAGTTSKVNEFIAKFDTSKLVGKVTATVSKLGDSIASIVGGSKGNNGLADAGGRLLDQLVDGMVNNTNLGNSLQRVFSSVTSAIRKYAPKIGLNLGNAVGKAFEFAGKNSNSIFDSAFTIMRSFMDGLLNNKSEIVGGALQFVHNLAVYVKMNAPYIMGAAREIIGSFVDGLLEDKDTIGEAFNSVIGPIYNIIQENLPKVCELAKSILSSLANTVKSIVFNLLADLLDGIANFMMAFNAVSGIIGAILMFIPGMQGVGSQLLASGISGFVGGVGLKGASAILRGMADGADEANGALWETNNALSTTTLEVGRLNKALEVIGNRETTFKIKSDGSVEELNANLTQLDLQDAFDNHEIIYRTVLTGEGEVVAKAFEVQATIDNGKVTYILVAKEDENSSGKQLVDDNITYAENNPMTQKLQIEEDNKNPDGKVTVKDSIWTGNTVSHIDFTGDETKEERDNLITQAENEVKKAEAMKEFLRNYKINSGQNNVENKVGVQGVSNTEFTNSLNRAKDDAKSKFKDYWKNLSKSQKSGYNEFFDSFNQSMREANKNLSEAMSKNEILTGEDITKVQNLLKVSPQSILESSSTMDEYISNLQKWKNDYNTIAEEIGAKKIDFKIELDKTTGEYKVTFEEIKEEVSELDGTTAEVTVEENTNKTETTTENKNVNYTTSGEGEVKNTTEELTKPEKKPVTAEFKVDQYTWDTVKDLTPEQSTKTLTVKLVVEGKADMDSVISNFESLPKEDYGIRISVVTDMSSLSVISGIKTALEQIPQETSFTVTPIVTGENSVRLLTLAVKGVPLDTKPKVVVQGAMLSRLIVEALTRAIKAIPLETKPSVVATVSGLAEVQALSNALNSLRSGASVSVKPNFSGSLFSQFGGFFAEGGTVPDSDYQIMNEQGGEIVDLPSGSRIYSHDDSLDMSYRDGMKAATQLIGSTVSSGNGGSGGTTKVESSNDSYDYSVNFSKGSIVVKVDNSNGDRDYDRMAQKVYDKIQTKVRRDKMARRKK